jgi:hypothetical protein
MTIPTDRSRTLVEVVSTPHALSTIISMTYPPLIEIAALYKKGIPRAGIFMALRAGMSAWVFQEDIRGNAGCLVAKSSLSVSILFAIRSFRTLGIARNSP